MIIKFGLCSTILARRITQTRKVLLSTAVKPTLDQDRNLLNSYKSRVTNNELEYNEKQYEVMKRFEKLRRVLSTYEKNKILRLKGMYLFGNVGTGKTMLMDTFFESCDIDAKRRVHFHDFMLEVHSRIHQHKQKLLKKYDRDQLRRLTTEVDSLYQVALEISKEAKLLCFDEFQVTDIVDAMIMTRLFSTLWSEGSILVATSNRPPQDLYQNGLNRQHFLPFIEKLEEECFVKDMELHKDYREINEMREHAHYVPNSPENNDKLWRQMASELPTDTVKKMQDNPYSVQIPVMMGRSLTLPYAAPEAGVAWCDFNFMCKTDKGAADYQALVKNFHTVYMTDIPQLSEAAHNPARRLIILIDALYNANTRFEWTSECEPSELFKIIAKDSPKPATRENWLRGGQQQVLHQEVDAGSQEEIGLLESELSSVKEIGFAFRRAASRLREMSTEHYYQQWKKKLK